MIKLILNLIFRYYKGKENNYPLVQPVCLVAIFDGPTPPLLSPCTEPPHTIVEMYIKRESCMRLFSVNTHSSFQQSEHTTHFISLKETETPKNRNKKKNKSRSKTETMMKRERDVEAELNLPPGFRFHPTDEELVVHYLCRKVSYQRLPVPIIAEIDLYKFDPWQLPEKALFGTKEWYFFSPRDRKYPNGSRPNRSARSGYWKATGADKPIRPLGNGKHVGIKKALVFYSGKAPKGIKTNWIMHEYRLAEPNRASNKNGSLRLDGWVLCRIYNKKNNWENIHNQKEESFLEGNMNSVMAVEETSSDSMRTTESDVENDPFEELDDPSVVVQGTPSLNAEAKQERMMKEEDNDWFTDLNLDDLKSSLARFEATPTPALDYEFSDYYYWGLTSPNLKPYQLDLPPF